MGKWNDLRFGKRKQEDRIDPTAYSLDGYLIHQGRLSGVRYGRKTTKETGCGWISCYNMLLWAGKPEPALEVAHRMESTLLWGGVIGSHPLAVWWFLYRRGFRFRFACTKRGMKRVLKKQSGKTAGVLGYGHSKGAHYVTFLREEENRERSKEAEQLRFLNAVYGAENHRMTVDGFFQKYVKFPICFVLVAKEVADT